MSVLIVGEDNPYGADPQYALYHLPPHASGGRLQRLVLGLQVETYEALPKVNLCTGKWSMPAARHSATRLRADPATRVYVLLGRKVASAFFHRPPEQLSAVPLLRSLDGPSITAVAILLPHPSGLNRAWNDRGLPERCRAILREHAPDIRWGELS